MQPTQSKVPGEQQARREQEEDADRERGRAGTNGDIPLEEEERALHAPAKAFARV